MAFAPPGPSVKSQDEPKVRICEFPYTNGWYFHRTILVDGQPLEGYIQVRKRPGPAGRRNPIDTLTCFRRSCVLGHDIRWLARQNGIELPET